MPRASASDAAKTATRILETATTLFGERGFADVSLEHIAAAAEVTRGAVYHHYESKARLFAAVADAVQSQVGASVVSAASVTGDSPLAQLRAGSHAFLDAIMSGTTARILLVDAPAVIGWQEWRRLDASHSATHLRDALRDAGVAAELLDATTAQLSGAMNEAALWISQQPEAETARVHAHTVLDRLIDAYVR